MSAQTTEPNTEKSLDPASRKLEMFEHPGERAPVLPSINDTMKFDLIINDKKKSMLIVDKPFPEILYWAEYDLDTDEMFFVTVLGKIQPLGKIVQSVFRPFLSQATFITAVRMQDEKLADNQRIPLIVRLNGAQFNRVTHAIAHENAQTKTKQNAGGA
tara:strand:+ start:223358 stop:223831 length:474 start_codon:yes stop_codon:yes gene_type:complete